MLQRRIAERATTTHGYRANFRASLFGVSALLFAASAAVTIVWCGSMSAMGGMPMPGGWTMSMAWMRMPGQTWLAAAASFLGMWVVMMVAMMLPSLVPMLRRYRRLLARTGEMRLGRLTTVVGVGLLLRLDRVRDGCFPGRRALTVDRNATARARARCAGCGRRCCPHRGCVPIHNVEGESPGLLPGGHRARRVR